MRVAIVTESFPPDVNGVANSVARIIPHLVQRGHEPFVIAPRPASGTPKIADIVPAEVVRVPAVSMPGYPGVRLALPGRRIAALLAGFRPDVVHLASPFVLGAWAVAPAGRLDVPTVAVYQTDIPRYTRAYGVGFSEAAAWRWIRRTHGRVARTLAPSTSTAEDLTAHGIPRVWLWRRGVDLGQLDPGLRSEEVRRVLAPAGETIVGYVGRLAAEKQVDLLAKTALLPGVRVVIIGDGPVAPALRRALPTAVFLGARYGAQLARLYASFDVFVHTGPYETFCQAVQEAMASGVPVVAPASGGPRDLVESGRTGVLVPPGSATAIAAAVAGLAMDPVVRAEYGRAGRATVDGRSWPVVVDELIGHYTAVLTSEPAMSPRPAAVPPKMAFPARS
ncbi:MAG: phosphatidylinositol alpha 1,6-mannosyltransferase [Micromonosporaceae bacterium]|nr:phosphatidylinositol alpha 1,6-mannosyltransferase [Micromonosporaceae bacterium]